MSDLFRSYVRSTAFQISLSAVQIGALRRIANGDRMIYAEDMHDRTSAALLRKGLIELEQGPLRWRLTDPGYYVVRLLQLSGFA